MKKNVAVVFFLLLLLSACGDHSPYQNESLALADFAENELKSINLCEKDCQGSFLFVNDTDNGFSLTFYEVPDVDKAKKIIDDIYDKYQKENFDMELDLVFYTVVHKENKGFRETFYQKPEPIITFHIAAK